MDYSDIIEVIKVGRAKANQALQAGYRLLAVVQESSWKEGETRNGNSVRKLGYVEKYTVFVLGRPEGVEAANLF